MLQENISLKEFTNYKIGGPARYFLEFKNTNELLSGLKDWQELSQSFTGEAKKIFILGGGTNLLVKDEGFAGLVLRNSISFIDDLGGNLYKIGSGTLVSDVNEFAAANSLSGTEWSGGLPGTIGGAVFGNAGAFGGETKDCVVEVESLDLASNKVIKRNANECKFGYRTSFFKTDLAQKEIILFVTIKFVPGDSDLIMHEIQEKIDYRQSRQPLEFPNAGSTFKNVPLENAPTIVVEECRDVIKTDPFPVIPAAHLINEAGLKGERIGGAEISKKHPNFLINTGNAKASDVLGLINLVKKVIKDKYEIEMEAEVICI